MSSPTKPLSYGVLLYPGFEVLDIAGPIECLNTLTHRPDFPPPTLSIIARARDSNPDRPQDITPGDPSPTVSGFTFQSKQIYSPTHTLDNAPPLDVLLIPGGFGSLPPTKCQQEVDFIARVYPSLQYLFTICTGSGLAAAAGVLDGHYATSNKAVWKEVTACGPHTYWVAHARWIVHDNIWTTSGVSAGTDGMVAFVEHVYGAAVAERMVNSMEYNRASDSARDHFSDVFGCTDVAPTDGTSWWSEPVTTWKGHVVLGYEL